MNRRLSFLAGLLIGAAPAVGAEGTNAPPGRLEYPAFKIISERNIFDPTRSPRSARRTDAARPSKVDSFALVGTLSYEKGTVAFFDGTGPEFRKALKAGDTIAGFKVLEIGSHRVRLEADGKQVELSVGMQLKRQDEGEWQPSGPAESFAPAAPSAVASGDKAEDTSGGEETDVVKRLMQKREQENQ